jgi:hypothetical protein
MKRHLYHLVNCSPWPLLGSLAAFFLTSGFVLYVIFILISMKFYVFLFINMILVILYKNFVNKQVVNYSLKKSVQIFRRLEGDQEKKFMRSYTKSYFSFKKSTFSKKLWNLSKRSWQKRAWRLQKFYALRLFSKINMKLFRNMLFVSGYNKKEVETMSDQFSGGRGHLVEVMLQRVHNDKGEKYCFFSNAAFTTKTKTKGILKLDENLGIQIKPMYIIIKEEHFIEFLINEGFLRTEGKHLYDVKQYESNPLYEERKTNIPSISQELRGEIQSPSIYDNYFTMKSININEIELEKFTELKPMKVKD